MTIDDTAATALSGPSRAGSRRDGIRQQAATRSPRGRSRPTATTRSHFTGSTLTITPATLTVTAKPETKVYGSTIRLPHARPVDTTVTACQFADTAATVLTGSLARAAGETVAGGPYAITPGDARGRQQLHDPVHRQHAEHHPGDAAGDRQRPGRDLHRRSDRGHGHRDRRRRHGDPGPGRRHADPDVLRRTGTSGTDLGSAAPSAAGTYTVVARFPGSADYAAAQSQPATFAIAPAQRDDHAEFLEPLRPSTDRPSPSSRR